MTQIEHAVTVKPLRKTRRAREWKATQIAQIVELAQRSVTTENASTLLRQVKSLLPARSMAVFPRDFSTEDVLSIQRELRAGLTAVAGGEAWTLPPSERIVDGWGSYLSGPLRSVFLHHCADLVAGERRISLCQGAPGENCETIIFRRKSGKFCRIHGSPNARSRRSRSALRDRLSPEDLRRQYHEQYKQRIARQKGRAAARKVRERQQTVDPSTLAPLAAADVTALLGPEPAQTMVAPAPPAKADFDTWLRYQLDENPRALKRTMGRTLSTREEDILRTAHGIRCDRASLPEIVRARHLQRDSDEI
jgi:hypothetical protein